MVTLGSKQATTVVVNKSKSTKKVKAVSVCEFWGPLSSQCIYSPVVPLSRCLNQYASGFPRLYFQPE